MISFFATLADNPLFAGGVGAAAASALLYQARALPMTIWQFVRRQCSVELIIDNSDELFHRLVMHLSRSPDASKARWLRMVHIYNDEDQAWEWQVSFGFGWHLFRDGGDWYLLHRASEEKSAGLSLQRRETVTVRTFGRSQRPLRELMKRAERIYDSGNTIPVYTFHSGVYMLSDRKPLRSFDTLFFPEAQKRRLIGDLDRFLVAREEYWRRSIPYRRGYLFKGAPGTGKTSIAFALASRARRPVYMINLSTCGGDAGLQLAFNTIEAGAFVVIEDADTAALTHNRNAPQSGFVEIKDERDKHVTLGGLLNAIDGMATRENRILVITSNHADKFDPALLRPGRIDLCEEIGLLDVEQACRMTEAFLGCRAGADRWFRAAVLPALPMSAAVLQGMLLGYENRPTIGVAA